MKKIIIIIVLCSFVSVVKAQDLIYTIGVELNEKKATLDSILVENFSNGTRILFKNLPEQDYYQINLTKKILLGTVGTNIFEDTPMFTISENTPGLLKIKYGNRNLTDARITVYNINGQKMYATGKIILNSENSFRFKLNTSGVFFIKIETPIGNQTFKAIGFSDVKEQVIEITGSNNSFKSSLIKGEEDFSYIIGDRIRISVYKNDYYALPSMFNITYSKSLDFTFNVPFMDSRDNRYYKTAKIGDQIWMAENLAYLPAVSLSSVGSPNEKHYYVYGYEYNSVVNAKNSINFGTFGVLYNWTAAMNETESSDSIPSGVCGVCPQGWHLPSKAEWTVLIDFLSNNGFGFEENDNDIAKSLAAKTDWSFSSYAGSPGNDLKSNNISGFDALPGGYRSSHDVFKNIGNAGYWWSSLENGSSYAEYIALLYDFDITQSFFATKAIGLSVRCVRD